MEYSRVLCRPNQCADRPLCVTSCRREDLGNAQNRTADEPRDAGQLGYQRTIWHHNTDAKGLEKWAFERAFCEANSGPWKSRLAWISTERNRPNIQIAKRFTRLKNPPVAVGQISVLIDPCA